MKRLFEFIKYMAKVTILTRIRYKVGILSDLLIMVGTYVLVFYSGGFKVMAEELSISNDKARVVVLIGFIFWQFSVYALGATKNSIEGDFRSGTIEAYVQSRYSLPFIYFVELIMGLVSNLIVVTAILLVSYFLNSGGDTQFARAVGSLIFVIPSIVGMYGFGLMLSAVVIKEKAVGSLTMIIQVLLIFASNTLQLSRGILDYIIPFSNGTTIARNFYLKQPIDLKLLLVYIVINAIWFLIGYSIFNMAINKERLIGSFDRY